MNAAQNVQCRFVERSISFHWIHCRAYLILSKSLVFFTNDDHHNPQQKLSDIAAKIQDFHNSIFSRGFSCQFWLLLIQYLHCRGKQKLVNILVKQSNPGDSHDYCIVFSKISIDYKRAYFEQIDPFLGVNGKFHRRKLRWIEGDNHGHEGE